MFFSSKSPVELMHVSLFCLQKGVGDACAAMSSSSYDLWFLGLLLTGHFDTCKAPRAVSACVVCLGSEEEA